MSDLLDAEDLRRTARARDRFLSGENVDQGNVRESIQRSWTRSATCGVNPDLRDLPEVPISTQRSRLYQAAEPILHDLSTHLADTSTALLLADREGVILGRWVADSSLLRLMDKTHSAPGFTLSEEAIGTNGLGSVLEERQPYAVIGPEHYADLFQEYSCFGAPIINPRTKRVEGVLTFVCQLRDSSPLMLPFVTSTSAQIVEQLPSSGSRSDKRLIAEFRAATRSSRTPTLLVGENVVMANPRGAEYMARIETDALWNAGESQAPADPADDYQGMIGNDRVVVRNLGEGKDFVGTLVRFLHDSPAAQPTSDADPTTQLRNRLNAMDPRWDSLLAIAVASYRNRIPLTIFGESGTGKASFARALHEVCTPTMPFTTLHAGLADVEGTRTWITKLRRALESPGVVVIEHIHALDEHDCDLLATVIESDARADHQLLATVCGDPDSRELHPALADVLVVQPLCMPSLRERVGDIPMLLRSMGHEFIGEPPRFTSEALQALCAYDWPGNLKQLRRLAQSLAIHASGKLIGCEDLPVDVIGSVGRNLSELERMERRAIQSALARCAQNKSQAAAQLGLSRATLYRKIRTYRI